MQLKFLAKIRAIRESYISTELYLRINVVCPLFYYKVAPPKPTDSNRFAGTISPPYEPLEFQARQLSPEQQAARQRSLERMKRGYPLGIAGMKREQFYD